MKLQFRQASVSPSVSPTQHHLGETGETYSTMMAKKAVSPTVYESLIQFRQMTCCDEILRRKIRDRAKEHAGQFVDKLFEHVNEYVADKAGHMVNGDARVFLVKFTQVLEEELTEKFMRAAIRKLLGGVGNGRPPAE
jgi:hypothetical protein